jgi:AraC-like DNA-binding protein
MIKQPNSDQNSECRVSDQVSDPASADSAVAVAQLIEAAACMRDGDREAAKARIARAMGILLRQPMSTPVATQVLHPVARQTPPGSLAAWQARKITAHIEANLCSKIQIVDLAALLGLSSSHFSRRFTRTFGISAHVWVMRRRIEVAQAMMLTTDARLSEIAQSCGMADQSHFIRWFHRVAGQTPSSWRRTRRGAIGEQVTGNPKNSGTQGPRDPSIAALKPSYAVEF